MIPDFTIICAVDASHIEELRLSYATWARHKPSLLKRPMLVMVDPHIHDPNGSWWSVVQECWRQQLAFLKDHPGGIQVGYAADCRGKDWPLRERMVSSFVFAAKHIRAPYYLKLDTDCIATGCDDWIKPEWFAGKPAIIAPPWGYTRPAESLAAFARWSDQHPQAFPRPMPEYRILGGIAKHRRMISYCQFGNTDWTWRMAELAGDRLPVPSQDTFLSIAAARSGAEIRYVPMKQHGWQHVGSNLKRLREAAARAMEMPTT